jgi:soluble lytic murein transglycosylase-like protein
MAGEYAILSSGLRLHVDHHESADGSVRLFDKTGGVTELAADQVKAFEPEDYVPPPPPPPTPPVPAQQQVKLPEPADPRTLVHDAAGRLGPPNFVKLAESVAKVESAFRPNAVSPKGALGVMQLMPDTARALAADPTDLEQNIGAGTRLLQDLLIKYNGDVVKALAAYNAGPGAVDRYQGIPPFRETQSYVDKVIRNYLQAGGN